MDTDILIKTIQLMLAPAVMISACGLLLLGIGGKNTSISNRLRLLNEEKRRYFAKIRDGKELDFLETTRFRSIQKQIFHSLFRLKLVRNVILCYVIGLFLFIFTSILIGLEVFVGVLVTQYIILLSFSLGLLCVATGLIYALTDTLKGYKIIEVETKADE
jgi:hypothetical protein